MNAEIFTFDRSSPQIPSEFWNVKNSPQRIYVQGKPEALLLLDSLGYFGLAVVGTRQPQPRSLDLIRKQVRLLSSSSVIIVSGLALGIDSCAHEAALGEGMPTVGILACGLDQTYPPENQELRERILENGGLIMSEYPIGIEPRPFRFLDRNRLIAGWTRATWVVEAGFRSGALNTAKWAREHEKLCFATPCFPGDPTLAGNQTLIDRDFATPVWGAHSFADAWLDLVGLSDYLKQDRKARGRKPALRLVENQLGANELALVGQIRMFNAQLGGVQFQYLMDWAMDSGWSAEEFLSAFDRSVDLGVIMHDHGIVSERKPTI